MISWVYNVDPILHYEYLSIFNSILIILLSENRRGYRSGTLIENELMSNKYYLIIFIDFGNATKYAENDMWNPKYFAPAADLGAFAAWFSSLVIYDNLSRSLSVLLNPANSFTLKKLIEANCRPNGKECSKDTF